eukprot:CAMPEP_0119006834 /NCGR_PEP_ID=MMETSP1176-20130426/2574_1 /TAXON_ID=265551 /ORGANISM="Synedropsis recta cf, Strain CCMP1620" /LENGTH=193 /DNA_ID=CAMNT_0006958839 /DNA_START=121 /DNA_END=702 /DNA_ORIENTATION=-
MPTFDICNDDLVKENKSSGSAMARPVLCPIQVNTMSDKSRQNPVIITTTAPSDGTSSPTEEIGYLIQEDYDAVANKHLLDAIKTLTTKFDSLQTELDDVKTANVKLTANNVTLTLEVARHSGIIEDHDDEIQQLQGATPNMEINQDLHNRRLARNADRAAARSNDPAVRQVHRDHQLEQRAAFHNPPTGNTSE